MGAGASSRAKAAEPAVPKTGPEFEVRPMYNLEDLPSDITLRLEKEALVLLNEDKTEVLRSYPYHMIMCWGHSANYFQWRCFKDKSNKEDLDVSAVATSEGKFIEDSIMEIVLDLMSKMKASGITKEEFSQLKSQLDKDGDKALAAIKQAAISRRYNIDQACSLVKIIGEISPFDKIETAVTMYHSLLNQDSFTLVLQEFEDTVDRDNVCHRLGIEVDGEGNIIVVDKKKNKK